MEQHTPLRVVVLFSERDRHEAEYLLQELKKFAVELYVKTDEDGDAADIIQDQFGNRYRINVGENDSADEATRSVRPDALTVFVSSRNGDSEILKTVAINAMNMGIPVLGVSTMGAVFPSYLDSGFPEAEMAIVDMLAEDLLEALNQEVCDRDAVSEKRSRQERESEQRARASHVGTLRSALSEGRLTLFCGAGVSLGAGFPDWRTLTARLFHLYRNPHITGNASFYEQQLREKIRDYDLLYLGKCLSRALGSQYVHKLRTCLYGIDAMLDVGLDPDGDIAPSIARLAENNLDSVSTFNYDSLLETCLAKASVPHTPIYDQGMICTNSLPIYHVHGYLPEEQPIPDANIVFSEDEYHRLYNDPYNWANLIQLNKLNQNTCLLVGISLADPNLRRLLGIALNYHGRQRRHFVIKRKREIKNWDDQIAVWFESADAESLGLNVVWVDNFAEIGLFLAELAE